MLHVVISMCRLSSALWPPKTTAYHASIFVFFLIKKKIGKKDVTSVFSLDN